MPELDDIPLLSTASSSEFGYCESLDEIGEDVWRLRRDDTDAGSAQVNVWDGLYGVENQEPNPVFIAALELDVDKLLAYNGPTTSPQFENRLTSWWLSNPGHSSLFLALNRERRKIPRSRQYFPKGGHEQSDLDKVQRLSDSILEIRRLGSVRDPPNSNDWTLNTVATAISNTASTTLLAIEEYCVSTFYETTDELELQLKHERIQSLASSVIEFFQECEASTTNRNTAEEAFEMVRQMARDETSLQSVILQMFVRVSKPWLLDLEEDVGLRAGLYHRTHVHGVEGPDSVQIVRETTAHQIPRFIPENLKSIIRESSESFALLQTHVSSHPLCHAASHYDVPNLEWALTADSAEDITERAKVYEATLREAMKRYRTVLSQERDIFFDLNDEDEASSHMTNSSFANAESASVNELSGYVKDFSHRHHDPLCDSVRNYLYKDTPITSILNASQLVERSLSPLLCAQHALLDQAVVTTQLTQYSLRTHLDVHYAFYFCSSGAFTSRLADTLFQPGLGLRNTNQSLQTNTDLRLILADVCESSWREIKPLSWSSRDIPGSLSLNLPAIVSTIRKNPFVISHLQMSYSPPQPLASIFTKSVKVIYASVFRQLLSLHYASWALQKSFEEDVLKCKEHFPPHCNATYAFRFHAQHVLAAVLTHFHDVGIEIPWKLFMKHLHAVERSCTNYSSQRPRTNYGRSSVIREHQSALDSIAAALLLEDPQRKAKEALRRVCEGVLEFVGRGFASASVAELYVAWKKLVADFVRECMALAEKEDLSGGDMQAGSMTSLRLLVETLEACVDGRRAGSHGNYVGLVGDDELDGNDWFEE